MKYLLTIMVLSTLFIACKKETKQNQQDTDQNGVVAEETDQWINLLDGNSAEGWRAYNGEALPPGWVVKDSVLTFDTELGMEQDYTGGQDIIYAAEEFDNFELYVEWKIPEGGNSGIFYHLKENIEGAGPPDISPEYQLIDDANYASIHDLTAYNESMGVKENLADLQDWQKTGSDYAMHPADASEKILYPVGEWNSTRIIFTPEKVEHWLNGKKILEFDKYSEDWQKRRNSGKWDDFPDYGKANSGHLGLQDHGAGVWFRNVRVRRL